MNTLMRNIMNNNQRRNNGPSRRTSVQEPSRNSNQQTLRRHFEFNNGYNSFQQLQSSTSPIIALSTNNDNERLLPTTLSYHFFETNIDICANNLTSELFTNYLNEGALQNNHYYSTFEYESLSIRFFHNEILDSQNINDAIEIVIQNINNREIQNLLNDFSQYEESESVDFINNTIYHDNVSINSQETIEKIHQNISRGEYLHYSATLKNHTCPIL